MPVVNYSLSPSITRQGTKYKQNMTQPQTSNFNLQIDNFSGEPQKLEWFIQQIKEMKEIYQWSDEMTFVFLKSKLSGSAWSWYSENPTYKNIKTFDEAVKKLREFFKIETTPLSNSAELNSIELMPGESIRNLAHRIEVLTSRTYTLLDNNEALNQIQSIQFLNALPLNMKQKLIHEDMQNFSSLVEKAQKIVLTEQSLNFLQIASSPKVEEPKNDTKMLQELRTQIATLSEQVRNIQLASSQAGSPCQNNDTGVAAFEVNYAGHNFPQQNFFPQQNIICNYCQKKNHTMAQCFMYKRHLRENNQGNSSRNFQNTFRYGYRPNNPTHTSNTFRPHNVSNNFRPRNHSQNFTPQQNLNFRRGC